MYSKCVVCFVKNLTIWEYLLNAYGVRGRFALCAKVQGYMASRSVNKVILVGHLGRDAETKFTPGGAAITRFSVATNRRWKDKDSGEWKEETDWSNVVLWRSENLANYLTKGKQSYVEGRLQTRSYEDKDGTAWQPEIALARFALLLGEADLVTGHYIRRHDLPMVNGALLEYGLFPLPPLLSFWGLEDLMLLPGVPSPPPGQTVY